VRGLSEGAVPREVLVVATLASFHEPQQHFEGPSLPLTHAESSHGQVT
jgi:hypothetical protein